LTAQAAERARAGAAELLPACAIGAMMRELFDRFTTGCARFSGRPAMLLLCMLLCVAGFAAFGIGDDHLMAGTSLAINVVTLMLLPILQATQNRDGAALQAKLDELIKTDAAARNALIGLENRSEDEIQRVRVCEEEDVTG
jgi:low affinity Fe/Cu permease